MYPMAMTMMEAAYYTLQSHHLPSCCGVATSICDLILRGEIAVAHLRRQVGLRTCKQYLWWKGVENCG